MSGPIVRRLSGRYRSWIVWIMRVIVGVVLALAMTTFAFHSFRVEGISMEPTLKSGDILLVNKLPVTFSGGTWTPSRGALIVFKNPLGDQSRGESGAFIVKRVVGLPGDRVVVADGRVTVYSAANPPVGLSPDNSFTGPVGPTSGNVNVTISPGELFVIGDNRQGSNSFDSRNGLSTVPVTQVEGIVTARFWPFTTLRLF